jgi:DNA-binding NarL/FixJ family response regulator
MIRVCIVDDHAPVRAGLEQLLSTADDLIVVGSVADGDQAVEAVARHQPDVVLMDLSMPVVDGVAATRAIAAVAPGVRVVVLTSSLDRLRILEAIEAGAVGYLLKDSEPADLFTGIRAASVG